MNFFNRALAAYAETRHVALRNHEVDWNNVKVFDLPFTVKVKGGTLQPSIPLFKCRHCGIDMTLDLVLRFAEYGSNPCPRRKPDANPEAPAPNPTP